MITDKRIIKTKAAIKNSFMLLMQQRSMSEITISDLAEDAQINRTTFYLHYANLPEVLDDIKKDINNTLTTCFSKFDSKNIYGSTYYLFINLTNSLNSTPNLKNFILHSKITNNLIQLIKNMFLEKWITCFLKIPPEDCTSKCYFDLVFMTGGIIDTYVKWNTEDKRDQSLEEICREIAKLAELIATRLID
jgi:AcrR family transcriptional regulator